MKLSRYTDNQLPSRAPVLAASPAGGAAGSGGAASGDTEALREAIIDVLKQCYDPEIPVDIYNLGLIYEINIGASNAVDVKMTLTSPNCPVAGTLPPDVEQRVASVPGVSSAKVEVVWDPPYDASMMSEAAKLQLNMM